MAAAEIVTFGCRLNAFESELIRRAAREAGLEDAVVINTCAVTAEAERQARQAIRRARRENPGARIVVTGCAATLSPARYAALPEVDLVLDNQAKLKAGSYAALAPVRPLHGQPSPQAGEGRGGGLEQIRARAYLQVQQGCDPARCTFRVSSLTRGDRAVGAGRARRCASTRHGRGGRPRGRADRSRPHRLRGRSAGAARASGRWPGASSPRCRS